MVIYVFWTWLLFAIGMVTGECPLGFVEHGDSCYRIVHDQFRTWATAMTYCRANKGGSLASIESEDEHNFLREKIVGTLGTSVRSLWIDGSDSASEGTWVWTYNNEPIQGFLPWGTAQPDDRNAKQNCLALNREFNYNWHDYFCEEAGPFICEIRLDTDAQGATGETCPENFVELEGSCYFFKDDPSYTWAEAMAICETYDRGTLAIVECLREQEYLRNEVIRRFPRRVSSEFWIGGNSIDVEGNWLWAWNNRPMSTCAYTAWGQGEPNGNNNENCLELNGLDDFNWNDLSCFSRNGFICEIQQEEPECETHMQADIVIVMDSSNSQMDGSIEQQKRFVRDLAVRYTAGAPNAINCTNRFAVVTYALEANVHFHFHSYQTHDDLLQAIDTVTHNQTGPTMTGNALRVVREKIIPNARSEADLYVLVLTGGLFSDGMDAKSEARNLLEYRPCLQILPIGVGPLVLHQGLLDITGSPQHVFNMYRLESLYGVLDKGVCTVCTTVPSDVAIVIDVSDHLSPQELNTQINAAHYLMTQIATVGPTGLQFSLGKFSDNYVNIFDFDYHATTPEMVISLNANIIADRSTQFATFGNVLNHFLNDGFSVSKGARVASKRIFVVITSGNFEDNDTYIQQLEAIKNDTTVVTVSAGRYSNMTSLLEIASDPAFVYIVGDDVYNYISCLSSLYTTLNYDVCRNS